MEIVSRFDLLQLASRLPGCANSQDVISAAKTLEEYIYGTKQKAAEAKRAGKMKIRKR